MIVSFEEIKREFPLKGIIVIGSHDAEEYPQYVAAGIEKMIYFEPVKSNYNQLISKLPQSENIRTFNIALGNNTGERKMYIETRNNGMSCSLLEPLKHL